MPTPLSSKWTLKRLIQNTVYYKKNRFEYVKRDVVKRITIKKIQVYNQKKPGEARTKYLIESKSWPQYPPYYIGFDKRGRRIKYQRTYYHEYDVTIQLNRLSINVPVKLRTGAIGMWDFSKKARVKVTKDRKGKRKIIESKNVERGLNGDFWFRLQWVYAQNGILYGRDYTTGPPKKVNPKYVVFLDKHMINTIKLLMEKGILKDDSTSKLSVNFDY